MVDDEPRRRRREVTGEREEYFVDSEDVRRFIGAVRAEVAGGAAPSDLVETLKPAFSGLLSASGWLPVEFARPVEEGGMGGGIGNYLLYRSVEPPITLMSLVVPTGSSTPVHDHLAWGLVGLYQGEQREEVYGLTGGTPDGGDARLALTEERDLHAGEFYPLLPPDGDIHRVTTTSPEPSISIHLLGNDVGCVVRHAFDPEAGTSASFRSGYSNKPCDDES
jgi:predicted metal-dependent enzyme (double-stranded beta helix superfamily)